MSLMAGLESKRQEEQDIKQIKSFPLEAWLLGTISGYKLLKLLMLGNYTVDNFCSGPLFLQK